jgi:hypothetical protein
LRVDGEGGGEGEHEQRSGRDAPARGCGHDCPPRYVCWGDHPRATERKQVESGMAKRIPTMPPAPKDPQNVAGFL